MNRSTFRLMPYINRAKTRADGTTAILLRITIDGKKTVMTTEFSCRPELWDAKRGEIISPTKDANALREFIKKAEQTYQTLLNEQGVVSSELLKSHLNGTIQPIRTLMEMAAEELERVRTKSAGTASNGSIKLAKFKNKCLKEYLMSIDREDMPLADVTLQLGKDYHIFLRQRKHLCPATANDCLAWLSRLVFLAVDKEILRSNPLEDIEYEKVKRNVEIRYLTREQIKILLAHPFQQRQMELARHMLLFTVFTGLAYVDLTRLCPEHIQADAKGRRFIRKCRQKTDVETFVPLHPIAEQILGLYNTKDNSKPVFPLPPYANYRLYKEFVAIGIFLGLDRNLSHHDARHTNATLLVSAGVNMESVSKMMGHSSIKSTQKYAQITVNRISEEMDRLMERRKEKEQKTDKPIQ